jgi:hypothetical protein
MAEVRGQIAEVKGLASWNPTLPQSARKDGAPAVLLIRRSRQALVVHCAVVQILRGGGVPIMNLDLLDFALLAKGGGQVSVHAGKIGWQVQLLITR